MLRGQSQRERDIRAESQLVTPPRPKLQQKFDCHNVATLLLYVVGLIPLQWPPSESLLPHTRNERPRAPTTLIHKACQEWTDPDY